MKTVRDACQLQPNALSIKLSDQIEQLDELISAEGDGTGFFEKTFITQGMQDLITEGVARLAGVSSQAVFHLKQAMGGGKTNLLVGFGLLARHADLRKKYCAGMPHADAFQGASIAAFNANQCLVPQGIPKNHWDQLSGAERFYLKLLDLEARGAKTLDNYQNFAKAFKVRDFQALMASKKANQARLKNAVQFGRTEMSEGSELHGSVLRAVLYAMMELVKNVDSAEVLAHLMLNIPDYYGNVTQRELAVELADYLAKHLEQIRPEEATAARVLRELVKNQRLG
jgi:hypothetical protein